MIQPLHIPKDPKEVFLSSLKESSNNPLKDEEILSYVSDRPSEWHHTLGRLNFIQGATFPLKSSAMPERVAATNILKHSLKFLLRNPFPIAKTLIAFNILIDRVAYQCDATGIKYYLKEEFLCPTARAIMLFITHFLFSLGINPDTATNFSYRLAHIFEYDDAYRYRLQDILSEVDWNRMHKHPRQQIKTLLKILKAREAPGNQTAAKITKLITPLLYLLIIPKIKRSFLQALPHLKDAVYDEADRYWACLKGDEYRFTGHSYEERTKGLQIPTAVKVNY